MEDDILQEFLAESWENLSRLDIEIVDLEKRPGDHALLDSIFRTIHTIKGTCGFIGLNGLGAVAHAAENVLGQMREGLLNVTPAAVSEVLQAVDAIKALLRGLEETGKEPQVDYGELIRRLNQLAEQKGSAVATSKTPVAPASVPGSGQEGERLQSEAQILPVGSGMPAPPPAAHVAVSPAVVTEINMPQPAPDQFSESSMDHGSTGEEGSKTAEPGKKSVADLSIRVNIDVVDRLMNLVGELVLTRNQLMQMVRGEDESKYATPISHLNRVTTDLQEGVMKTRMQPIGNAWSKLPRLVRDLSQTTGKQIELEMSGAETELDRTVLDAIKDPLTHMVRNSADHGIEPPSVRRAQGKQEIGKVKLTAYHEGGHVIICIEDDGAGIPIEKVRQKAVKNGLISEKDAARLSDKEVLQFVFLPGLSTADKVTSVSGRGVGMDVVKTQIERIGGVVDLASKPGAGTTVRIKIPLTLAIISALVVESGGLSFAIPQLGVVELVRLSAEDRQKIERIHNNEVFRLRKRLLPLVHLDRCLELPADPASAEQDINIVVVQVGEEQFGMIVSEVFDTEEIVVKPVGQLLKNINIYQGTTILGDGRVIMILDVAGIAAQFGGLSAGANDRDQQRADQDAEAERNVTSLLLLDGGQDTPMAVPLSLVARLEEFPQSAIEHSGDRLVVQYRGDLLPLVPIHGGAAGEAPDPQPVVVFSEGDKSMGLMVVKIQDIIEAQLAIRMQSQRPGVLGTAIVNGKATDILDTHHYVTEANPEWFSREREQHAQRVLVVDDSIFFRQLVTTALENEGYRVKPVDGARQALALLERGENFDLIVSDIEMPGMDGFEFVRTVKERRLSEAPVVALTSLGSSTHEARGLRDGFTRYMIKFNAKQFLSTVQELCNHSVHIQSGASA